MQIFLNMSEAAVRQKELYATVFLSSYEVFFVWVWVFFLISLQLLGHFINLVRNISFSARMSLCIYLHFNMNKTTDLPVGYHYAIFILTYRHFTNLL